MRSPIHHELGRPAAFIVKRKRTGTPRLPLGPSSLQLTASALQLSDSQLEAITKAEWLAFRPRYLEWLEKHGDEFNRWYAMCEREDAATTKRSAKC